MSFSSSRSRPTSAPVRAGLVAVALLGALGVSGCKISFATAGMSDDRYGAGGATAGEDSGGEGGAGNADTISGGGSLSGGGGGDDQGEDAPPPTYAGNYADLCGGPANTCTPGTGDCTPGGNPSPNGAGGGAAAIGCQLAVADDAVVAQCAPVGQFEAGGPCDTASDCGPGLGCVMTGGSGICREYCCGDVEACPSNTYCAPVSMAEAPSVKIPACIKVKDCQLLEDKTCADGLTCTIVREDGTTSCVEPGSGQRGDACPCAPGFVCSKVTNTCVKLCHIGNDGPDCGDGACQGGVMGYPDGIGICVGYP